jgi:hypothetical protein
MYEVKTSALYWPAGGIYTLSSLEPGKGYISNFKNAVSLTYPIYDGYKSASTNDFEDITDDGPWPCHRSAIPHFVAINSQVVDKLQNAAYIGAFDPSGNCIGFTAIDGGTGNCLLTLYGDDITTDAKDGAEESEPVFFRSYNPITNQETELIAEFNQEFPNSDGLFNTNGQSEIINFKVSAPGIVETGLAGQVQIFPNPAKDAVNIVLTGNLPTPKAWLGLKATLISVEGKVVKTFTINRSHTQIDVGDLQPGVYILKFESMESTVIKRLVIQ